MSRRRSAGSERRKPFPILYVIRIPRSIQWGKDRLGRSSLVEVLALKILVAKAPVIALRGGFGDGKSSVLNLLRRQIEGITIVVSFSSWLPDSQRTLVHDLFGDISSECNRAYVISGLRKELGKFASIVAGTTPYLKILPDLVPTETHTPTRPWEHLGIRPGAGKTPLRSCPLVREICHISWPVRKRAMLQLGLSAAVTAQP